MPQGRVLVTGGSGFIAGHCILQLLANGFDVRATLRDLRREASVRADLAEAAPIDQARLRFVAADLDKDDGWAEAVSGVDFVLHTASPLPTGTVEDEEEVIRPAREGTLRVLRAARDGRAKRVVLTSAFHAVGFGHRHVDRIFTEQDWSIPDGPGVDAYGRSKILSEKAAWDFMASQGGALELTTLLPVAVMGSVLGERVSGANHIVQLMLNGAMPGIPNVYIPIVDVRDVAFAHVAAMTSPEAGGHRFLVSTGEPATALKQVSAVVRGYFPAAAARVPTRSIPDFVVRIAAQFRPEFSPVAADLNYVKNVSNEQARAVLGLRPRTSTEAILASAQSLITKSLVKHP